MAPESILVLILLISGFGFMLDLILEWINLKIEKTTIPPEVADFYPEEAYLKSRAYHRAQTRLGFASGAVAFLLSFLMLALGGFGWLDVLLRTWISNEIVLALVFFGSLAFVADLLNLPFDIYSTFGIEDRFGFNKTTVKTFVSDKLKSYLVGASLGGALLAALIFLVQHLGDSFWIVFGAVAAAFLLFANVFYTSLILPLFNKLTPLPDGELRKAIYEFAAKVNFPITNIFVMDGSRRSAKANAFFSGFGRRKKIVLYDTLLEKHSVSELVAVLAHEVGHFKKKHIVWTLVLSVIQIFFVLFVLSQIIQNENISSALGGNRQSIHLNLVAFGILFSPISGLTGLLLLVLSRKNEYEADAYAASTYDGSALAAALKKLSVDSLSNLYPHPTYVFFNYSHPPLLSRLARLQNRSSRADRSEKERETGLEPAT